MGVGVYGTLDFLERAKGKVRKQLQIAERRLGFQADIFYPKTDQAAYGTESLAHTYNTNTVPDETRVCLISGVMLDSTRSLVILDPYFEGNQMIWVDPWLLREYAQGTLLMIKSGQVSLTNTDRLVLRVDNHLQSPGGKDPICHKYTLIPG